MNRREKRLLEGLRELDGVEEEELRGLDEVVRALDAAAEEDRRRDLEHESVAGIEEAARAPLADGLLGSEVQPIPKLRTFAWMPAVAAALLLVALGVHFWGRTDTPAEPSLLDPSTSGVALGAGPELLEPRDEGSFELFRWRGAAPLGGGYEVRIWDATAPSGAAPLIRSERTEETQWRMSEERSRSLPAAIRWDVTVFGPFGNVVARSQAAQARRSSSSSGS